MFSGGFKAVCIPLQSIIDYTGLFDINLFSLDVEGAEYAVLTTVDWTVTNVQVVVVELDAGNPTKDQQVRDLLLQNGFEDASLMHGSIRDACVFGGDCALNEVFVNPRFDDRRVARMDAGGSHQPVFLARGSGIRC